MSPQLDWIRDALPSYGAWLLAALTFLETSFLTGIFVPAGLSVALATVLALSGELVLGGVVAGALAGGCLGDVTGFLVGRRYGGRILHLEGGWAKRLTKRGLRIDRLLAKRPIYSVTGARLVPFVRTVMPITAGSSGLGFGPFVVHQLPGLVGYVAIYVLIGFLAKGSWEAATRLVGTVWNHPARGGDSDCVARLAVEATVAYTVAITGNAASGKSAVGAVWREMAIPVVDADRLSRDAVAPGTLGLDAVRLAFGDGVIAADGGLDRARMREMVFGDSGARARLEGIVHPIVLRKLDEWMGQRAEAGEGLVACEVPLLFELGNAGSFRPCGSRRCPPRRAPTPHGRTTQPHRCRCGRHHACSG